MILTKESLASAQDIVANRKKLSLLSRFNLMWLVVRENGLNWLFFLGLYYLGSAIGNFGFRRMENRRRRKGLPGLNSRAINEYIWKRWDWQSGGEEWTLSPEWKQSLVSDVLERYVPASLDVLEIGPGGGRWTEHLQKRARHLTAVDISEECVKICRERFADCDNVTFFKNSGKDLEEINDETIDAIWSFDVFVHINEIDVERYLEEFDRILRPGGVAVIHHGSDAGQGGGWRSDLTVDAFNAIVVRNGLQLDQQLDSWQTAYREFQVGLYNDVITVVRKPARQMEGAV